MSSLHSFKAIFVKGLALASLTLLVPLGHANTFNPDSAQDPLFLTAPVRPLMMLNMSNDHQLFFKLYDDYTDLDEDGVPDTTYKHDYEDKYYGYFDSDKCYVYSNGRFEPDSAVDEDGYCNTAGSAPSGGEESEGDSGSDQWNGNFLNWATMTRIDAVRKILYGGKRSTDTAATDDQDSVTVLERAFLPNDAHSFAKYYDGDDINKLVPFSVSYDEDDDTEDRGITICNTTNPDNNPLSQNVNSPPLLRIAEGNFSLWASNERRQCLWQDDIRSGDPGDAGENGNDASESGIFAHDDSPDDDDQLGSGDYNVRVLVCDTDFDDSGNNPEGCKRYGSSYKPTGLLQRYGEDGTIHFGLMTGSYGANKSGGLLRKNVGSIDDEIDLDNGTFIAPGNEGTFEGIIRTLDLFRIYGYRFQNGTYFGTTGSDSCEWEQATFDNGDCSNWGNPQSELYLESLRYLAGLDASGSYEADDTSYISGLEDATWEDALTNDNYCAPLNVVQFNASTSSYDGDELSGASGLGIDDLGAETDEVGDNEDISGNEFFVGEIDGDNTNSNQLCTAKTVDELSTVLGTCPDAPRLEGSYQIAGLAHYARSNGISVASTNKVTLPKVMTYGVALAPAVPRVTVTAPGGDRTVSIQPACRNTTTSPDANCAIVDFKIVSQDEAVNSEGDPVKIGRLYVNWEDSEQGGDYDQDMWGVIDYEISSSYVEVTTNAIADSTPNVLGFGYIISGTSKDGFHVHSGINGFDFDDDQTDLTDCGDGCDLGDSPTTNKYSYPEGTVTTSPLEQPLYYAAKWGGYTDDSLEADAIAAIDPPENYFFATDPRELASALGNALGSVAASVGSASAVATNSTRLEQGGYVYQARFNSEDWSGEVRAFSILAGGRINSESAFSTNEGMENIAPGSRNVFTVNSETGEGVPFEWDQLSDAQRESFELADGPDTVTAQDRFNWVLGSDDKEESGDLRDRDVLLGDIVNSSPVYFGARNEGLASYRGDYRDYLEVKAESPPLLLVGANDGMLHAFYADDSSGQAMQERFAYVPKGVYPYLANLSEPNYGSNENPHHYTVDGGLAIADVYDEGSEQWRTVVAGTLGAGGKGVYALDITDPSSPEVIFDYTGENDDDLGYITGSPVIARTADGKWRVVFGNGYDAGGDAYLFAVDLDNPSLTDVKIAAGDVSTGLSPVSLLTDRSGAAVRGYAGDLKGNMWRFDLNAESSDDWSLGLEGAPLFTARDADDNLQPITAPPELGFNLPKSNAVMVYFGTGKYLDQADNDIDYGNSIYAIADTGEALSYTAGAGFDRSDILFEKELSLEDGVRKVTGNFEVDWSENDGWFLDFDLSDGERLVQKPSLLFDRLLFATILPSTIPCEYGGTSWLMELAAVGDRFGEDTLLQQPVQTGSMILGSVMVGILNTEQGLALWNTSDGKGFTDEDDENDEDHAEELCDDNCEELKWPESALGRQSWQQIR